MTIPIEAGGHRYDAIVGANLRRECGALIAARLRGPRCAVVADENTAGLFADEVMASLRAAHFVPTLVTIPAGEGAKSLAQARKICDAMSEAGLDRSSFVVALGGGVVGDVAGFCAAIYHRGIAHVQMPTTLLAQVDSAIGGKTAVNTADGKNLLGVVHQPALVLADVETLETLPAREFNQGFAEIIKHAIIADPALFEMVAQASSPPIGRARPVASLRAAEHASWKLALPSLIARNIEIKAAIVARDERDATGERAVLNFGHTIGHAIERAAGYGSLLHGEAISLGIVAACDISVRKAGLPAADFVKVAKALAACRLPTKLPAEISDRAILEAVRSDKKFERAEVRFVVTPALGSAHLTDAVSLDEIAQAVARLRERRFSTAEL